MLLLKLLDDVQLLLLVGRRQSHRLLPLVEHHLLDGLTSFAIQIAEVAVLRLDFRNVDGIVSVAHGVPPFHLVELLQVDDQAGAVLHGPEGIVDDDGFGEGSVDDVSIVAIAVTTSFGRGHVSLETDLEMLLGYDHIEISTPGGLLQRDDDVEFLERLGPHVLAGDGTAIANRRWCVFVLLLLLFTSIGLWWSCISGGTCGGSSGIFLCLGLGLLSSSSSSRSSLGLGIVGRRRIEAIGSKFNHILLTLLLLLPLLWLCSLGLLLLGSCSSRCLLLLSPPSLLVDLDVLVQHLLHLGHGRGAALVGGASRWSCEEISFPPEEGEHGVEHRLDASGGLGHVEVQAVESLVVGELGGHG